MVHANGSGSKDSQRCHDIDPQNPATLMTLDQPWDPEIDLNQNALASYGHRTPKSTYGIPIGIRCKMVAINGLSFQMQHNSANSSINSNAFNLEILF